MFDPLFDWLFDRLPRKVQIGCWILFGVMMAGGLAVMLFAEQ